MAEPVTNANQAPHWSVNAREGSAFIDRLVDLSIEANLVPDRDFHYKWQEYADWQFETLKRLGLKPEHRLLDVGCGPLRLGMNAIPYLDEGNFFGIDAYQPYIELGRKLLAELRISRSYSVLCSSEFEFEKFGAIFDYAIAQSVFTHMSGDQIRRCVSKLRPCMKPGGTFVFTYFLTTHQRGIMYYGIQPMTAPLLRSTELFRSLAREESIRFEESALPHPAQSVGIFRF